MTVTKNGKTRANLSVHYIEEKKDILEKAYPGKWIVVYKEVVVGTFDDKMGAIVWLNQRGIGRDYAVDQMLVPEALRFGESWDVRK